MDVDMMLMLPCFLELQVYFKSIATNYRSSFWDDLQMNIDIVFRNNIVGS